METAARAWAVDLIGAELGGDPAAVARALAARAGDGARCVVVEGESALRRALDAMIAQARTRGNQFRDALDALGQRQVAALQSLGARAEPALIASVREDVRDLADAFQALHGAGPSDEVRNAIASYAPLWTARALAFALRALGLEAVALDARDLLVAPAHVHEGDARALDAPTREALLRELPPRGFAVIAGGFATTPDQRTTSLGASGADHCAATIAALLGASTLSRWCGGGALEAYPGGPPIAALTYATAGALGACGHPGIRPVTWEPLIERGISLTLVDAEGAPVTQITPGPPSPTVQGFGVVRDIALVNLVGRGLGVSSVTWRSVFVALHDLGVTPLLFALATGAYCATLAFRADDAEAARARLAYLFEWEGRSRVVQSVTCARGAMILLAGGGAEGLRDAMAALSRAEITPLASAQGGDGGAGIVVSEGDVSAAVTALRGAFSL